MPIKVDPAFEKSGRAAKTRRRKRLGQRVGLGLAAFVIAAGLGAALLAWLGGEQTATVATSDPQAQADPQAGDETGQIAEDEDFTLVQSEATARAAVAVERLNSFVDLRRDPMILRFSRSDTTNAEALDAPEDFASGRLARSGPDAVVAVRDALFVAERRLVTTLPSSRDDFALFKAQRQQGLQAQGLLTDATPVAAGELVSVAGEGSWGAFIAADEDAGHGDDHGHDHDPSHVEDTAAVFVETRIENTTSVAVTLRESQRQELFKDEIIVLQAERELGDVLVSAGVGEAEADNILRAVTQKLGQATTLPANSVVALRLRPGAAGARMLLMSLYGPDGYLASLAQIGAGRFEPSADPWISTDLMARSDQIRQDSQSPGEVRLLDALYSAAIRNGLPTEQVGELIVLMSQKFDLDRFVVEGDEMILLRAAAPGPESRGLGEILYLGIHGSSETLSCYVLKAEDAGYSCFDFNAPGTVGGGSSGTQLGGGLLVPVNGVKTSGFGPRHHPILKQVRNHNGVDWAAPTGTPVLAVAAGRVELAGDGGAYGNVVYLDHGNGVQTRYAHLSGFAKGLRKSQTVAAGEVIGYVGTTGRSTGPHLHFELRVNGRPLDPLTYAGGGTGAGGATQAVEALVNQIIKVESAGNATAKNPRSTATGLGQFIQSTWLRMMRDYRPDLVRNMNREQLLALRTDPVLSRQMVTNLARENEAFLRARGHQITAGRLYLAHFLGPAGANTALRADPDATVLSVMGASVVNANPFLRGKSISDLLAWSDRKMRGSSRAATITNAPIRRVIPPEVLAYRKAVDAMIEAL